jgi:uncharacterized membrane protein
MKSKHIWILCAKSAFFAAFCLWWIVASDPAVNAMPYLLICFAYTTLMVLCGWLVALLGAQEKRLDNLERRLKSSEIPLSPE